MTFIMMMILITHIIQMIILIQMITITMRMNTMIMRTILMIITTGRIMMDIIPQE